eukprot:CAMPEP_0183296662 /NCGR_PEP_ID=MMETSP0160_2-20130417/4115_1 /TAXON_ID=2839 ORGANISM="Odontella Sinensis, Strain Grunow 1884" /NCGR_SAMPLE_ID=MMETSP0160_2 /ASSEMBLY_ACC=CAM_ASM_000250 /LENGTH=507 /DNA_ID=CAMNT_0025458297 /DNA_START=176 /DNA_END=1699 /DNA_ORIENTATION=-
MVAAAPANAPSLSRPVQVTLPGSAGCAFVIPSSPSSSSTSSECDVALSALSPAIPSLSRAVSGCSVSSLPSGPRSTPQIVASSPSAPGIAPTTVPNPASLPSRPIAEFLFHLTRMLTDPANRPLIEWTEGKIRVHDPHKLESDVLGRFFRHSKYSSFQRQLNYFGFKKVDSKGKMSPCWFVNEDTSDDLTSLLSIKRKPANRARKAQAARAKSDSNTAPISEEELSDSESSHENKEEEKSRPSKRRRTISAEPENETKVSLTAASPIAVTADEFGAPGTLNFHTQLPSPVMSATTSPIVSSTSVTALPTPAAPCVSPSSPNGTWENLHLPSALCEPSVPQVSAPSAAVPTAAVPVSAVPETDAMKFSVPNPLANLAPLAPTAPVVAAPHTSVPVTPVGPLTMPAAASTVSPLLAQPTPVPEPVSSYLAAPAVREPAASRVTMHRPKNIEFGIASAFPSVEEILSMGVPSAEMLFPSDESQGSIGASPSGVCHSSSLTDLAMLPGLLD